MIRLPKNIEYILTDCDGVLTDNFLYINDSLEGLTKRANFRDIMAISLAIKNGYKVGIISGEKCKLIDYIQEKFNLTEVFCNVRKKAEVIEDIIERNNLDANKVVYIGDDVNDIEALKKVGYPITVANAVKQIKEMPNIQITTATGGNGALREIIDVLLY